VAHRDVHPSEMPHDPLDSFLDDLRSAAADTPSPAVGGELATLFRDGAEPVVSPTAAPRRRRWSVRAAVAGAVAGVTFGGLGIAGALPGPVQRGVADVARQVGVSLPDDDEPTTTTVTVPAPTTRVVPTPTTATERSGDDDEPRHSDGGDEAPATTPSDDHGDEDSSNRDSDDGEDSGSSDDDETDDSSASGPGGGSQAADRDNDSEGRSQ
jgi:hypothetical protein